MQIIDSKADIRDILTSTRLAGQRIALVPTMGNLHQGHLDLVEQARKLADCVVVSIFINPMQFGAGEDLSSYPRTLEADKQQLQSLGVDYVFAPSADEVYGRDIETSTQVIVPGLSDLWCGEFRPGHFVGVTTVVNKLFNIIQPDIAVFGEKDFQQLTLIRHMVEDLDIPVDIHGVATRREADGLAMSSRNGYLSAAEREIAPMLNQQLEQLQQQIGSGQQNYRELETEAAKQLDQAGFSTEFIAICRVKDLQRAEKGDNDLVILAAAHLGKARLIDNRRVA